MPAYQYELIDVFTDVPLAGNQLAVFASASGLDDLTMQLIARELNLSETVFLFPAEGDADARMRLFTSWCELPFAGHPVLGTACLLALRKGGSADTIKVRLETGRGVVPIDVHVTPQGSISGWMEQPTPKMSRWPGDPDALVRGLGAQPSSLPMDLYDNGVPHTFLMLDSIEDVLDLQPDFAALRESCAGARINCFAGAEGRYTSRMFSPFELAFPEDPACGSAAGPLAVHLLRYGLVDSGALVTISQGEKVGRPSTLLAVAEGSASVIDDVRVGGSCVPVGEGTLFLP